MRQKKTEWLKMVGTVLTAALAALVLMGCPSPVGDNPTATTPVANTAGAPTASVAAGAVARGQHVTLSTTITGASVYYTTDGTEPTATSTLFSASEPIEIRDAMTIKAKAFKDGMDPSATASFAYTLGNGFTVVENGVRTSYLEGAPGTAVPNLQMRAYGGLFGQRFDRDVLSIAAKNSIMGGTASEPSLSVTLMYDYGVTSTNGYDSMIQFAIPWSSLSSLLVIPVTPVTVDLIVARIPFMFNFDGLWYDSNNPPPNITITSASVTIERIDAVGGKVVGSFAIQGTQDGTPFAYSGLIGATRGSDPPTTLGTASAPFALYPGVSYCTNDSTNSSTSYYRVPVVDCNYSFTIMAGSMNGGVPDTDVTFSLEGDGGTAYIVDSGSGTTDTYSTTIHQTDGFFDFSVTDASATGDPGAVYMIAMYETYADTAAFLVRYDANGNGSAADDVTPGTTGVIGTGGTYTTTDIDHMLMDYQLNTLIPNAHGYTDGDEILYGKADATGEYIFAIHRLSSGDAWDVSIITEVEYQIINERDPYYVP